MTEDKLFEEIMDYDAQMVKDKEFYKPVFQDIIDYVLTHQPDLQGDIKGENRSEKKFDGTPTSAVKIATNGTYGLMVAKTMRWFKLKMSDEELDSRREVRIWLQDTENRLYSAFNRSNFYSTIKPYIKDGFSIGTANLYSQEDMATGKIYFTTIPIRDYRISLDKYGNIDRLHRDLTMTAKQLEQKFGYDNLTTQMQTALDSENRTQRLQEFKLIHAVFPRADTDISRINNLNMPFASVWLAKSGEKKDLTKVLLESGLPMFPYTIWRFETETGETYGRSPIWDILSEIKGAHIIEEDLIKATELSVKPPMNVHINMKGNFKRIPDAINYFVHPDEKASATDLGINFPASFEHQERKRQLIKETLFVDFFLLIASRPQTKTATEVLELQGEKISILAPMVASLSSDALEHFVERVFSIEFQAGRLTEPPEILRGQKWDIEFLGPLAQLQKMRFETRGTQQALELIRPMVIDYGREEILDNIDWDKTGRETLVAAGFPEVYLKDEKQIDELRVLRQQVIELQQKAELAEMQSKALKNVSQSDKNLQGKFSKALEEGATV